MANGGSSCAGTVRLNRENHYVWSKIAQSDLVLMKCWDAVDPGFGDEGGQSISSFSISQKAKNAAALAYILKTVEPYYFEDIGECQTAREAWKILEDIYTNISTLHVLMYLKELVTTQKGPDERMQDYLGRITATNRKCAKAGLTFGEKADAHFYLLGLL